MTKVRLIRTGAATHSFDHNARMMELQFTTTETIVNVKAPQHGDLAPPGYYLLYICTGANGQNPSEGVFSKLFQGGIGPGGGP